MDDADASPSARTHENSVPYRGIVLVLAVIFAFANGLHAPFVFDDLGAIANNPTLRGSVASGSWWSGPADTTVSGRPLLNASFALSHALGGGAPPGHRVVNIAIHAIAAIVLFGLSRRTLARCVREAGAGARNAVALVLALLWALHPLQTESVTYLVQRAESLAALFYLLTLYCLARGLTETTSGRWLFASVAACAFGVATKETVATAPVVALLFDRTFGAGTFRDAWRRRRVYYLALAATWLLLAVLVAGTHGRSGSAGFNADMSPWHYLLTQARAIPHYIRLVLWPTPLVFDYGIAVAKSVGEVALPGLLVLGGLAATAWALVRQPIAGFLGASFFLLLAPSSSFMPVATQTMAEHRMYLALAPLIAGIVALAAGHSVRITLAVGAGLALGCGVMTAQRNTVYRDALGLWSDTAAKVPENGRAFFGMAAALAERGRKDEAVRAYQKSIQLDPDSVEAHNNLALLLRESGRVDEARLLYEQALALDPEDPEAHTRLGALLAAIGQPGAALPHFDLALRKWTRRAEVHVNYGGALLQLGRIDEAVAHLETAVTLDPANAEAHYNLGLVLLDAGRLALAETHFRAVVQAAPKETGARNNLGYIALNQGRVTEAIEQYRAVVALEPGEASSYVNLGHALLRHGDLQEALSAYERASELAPDVAAIRAARAFALEKLGRATEAREQYQTALRLDPSLLSARQGLARLRQP